jgi:hypothetical protein
MAGLEEFGDDGGTDVTGRAGDEYAQWQVLLMSEPDMTIPCDIRATA